MPMIPADKPPAVEGGTPTLIESDVPERITLSENRRTIEMSDADKAELERLRQQDAKPVLAITSRQLTTLITILTGVASTILGGGYVTMTSQVETVVDDKVDASVADKVVEDVAAKDEANRQIVKEELAAVMVTVTARVDKDREGFAKKLDEVSDKVAALDDRMEAQEKAADEQKSKLEDGLKGIETQQTKMTADIIKAIKENKAP